MTDQFFTYVTVTFFLVITPGMTTAVVIQASMRRGHRAGVQAALGAAVGNSTHALLAGLGVAVLLRQWPSVLAALRIGGGLYLGWLGLSALRQAWQRQPALPLPAVDSDSRPAFRQGWAATMLNPSIATFYLAVVPGFIPAGGGSAAFAALAAVHVSMAFSCHVAWAVALDRLRRVLTGRTALRTVDAVAGTALLLLGISLLR